MEEILVSLENHPNTAICIAIFIIIIVGIFKQQE